MYFRSSICVEDDWPLYVNACALEHSIPGQGKYGYNPRRNRVVTLVPSPPTPAEDDTALSDGSSVELVETGLPEEPCFYGSAWNNRQWRGWKICDTPQMPPKEGSLLNSSLQAAHYLLPK